MTTTISVKEQVRDELLKVAAQLRLKEGRKVDLNDAIEYLLAKKTKRPDLLARASSPPGDVDKALAELKKGRKEDELGLKRRYGI